MPSGKGVAWPASSARVPPCRRSAAARFCGQRRGAHVSRGNVLALVVAAFVTGAGPGAAQVRVLDGEGTPLAGARVAVGWEGADRGVARLMPFIRRAVSDAEGIARVGLPVVPGVVVLVDHEAFAPARVPAGTDAALAVRLERGSTWVGRAAPQGEKIDSLPEGGTACVTMAVPFAGGERRLIRCAPLGPDGGYAVGGIGGTVVSTTVTAPGYLPFVRTGDGLPREVELARGITLSGVIRDGSGRPVEGARVACGAATLRSTESGAFLAAAAKLPADIEVHADGYRVARRQVTTPESFAVTLERGERITATLLGEEGPLTGEVLAWLETRGVEGRWHATSFQLEIAEGNLGVDLPGPGEYRVTVRPEGYRELVMESVTIGPQETASLGARVLERGPGVRGIVVDAATGEAVGGALVELLPTGPALYLAARHRATSGAVSKAQGEFLLAGLPLGRYLLRVQRAGLAPVFRLVDVARSRTVELGFIGLGEGVAAGGRVVRAGDQPPNDTPIHLYDAAREFNEPLASAVIDEGGVFRLPSVTAGRYRLEVGGDRIRWAQEIELRAGHDTDMELPVGGVRLRGVVTRDGLVVPSGSVWMQASLDPSNRRPKFSLRTDAGTLTYGFPGWHGSAPIGVDGVFTVEDVPSGQVTVGYEGAGGSIVRGLAVPDAAEATVTIELSGSPLSGRVVDAQAGTGLAATVTLVSTPGRPPVTERCDERGLFRFSDVAPGTYAVRASAPGFAPVSLSPIPTPLDAPLPPITLRKGDTGAVKVVLRRGPEWPLEGVPVLLVDEHSTSVTARMLMADGELTLKDVDAGSYRVAWADPLGGVGVSDVVEVEAGATVTVAPALASGASVTLACPQLRCAGAPVQAVTVIAAGGVDVSPLLSAVTLGLRMSAAGELPLGRLAPGRYRITLHVAGHAYDRDLDVESGEHTVRFQ